MATQCFGQNPGLFEYLSKRDTEALRSGKVSEKLSFEIFLHDYTVAVFLTSFHQDKMMVGGCCSKMFFRKSYLCNCLVLDEPVL